MILLLFLLHLVWQSLDQYKWTYEIETHRLTEWTYDCCGEGWGKEIVREFGMGMYTLLYLKWITKKDLL